MRSTDRRIIRERGPKRFAWPDDLKEHDRKVLIARAISPQVARRNKLSSTDSALMIPVPNSDGVYDGYYIRRPHTPVVKDGKVAKYLAPAGQGNRAFVSAECRDALRDDPTVPVVLTESALKALALESAGHIAVGLNGVNGWNRKGTDELVPELAALPLDGRTVYVVFDFDPKPTTRGKVAGAMARLARALRKAGAGEVLFVSLPPGPGGGKQGVDDLLATPGGAERLAELIDAADPVPDPPAFLPLKKLAGRTEVNNAARFVGEHQQTVRWVAEWDKWLVWDGRRWRMDSGRRVYALAKRTADGMWAELSGAGGDELKGMIAHARHSNSLRGLESMVSLARSADGVAVALADLDAHPWLLNCSNGTLDLRTGRLLSHHRDRQLTKLCPVEFDPAAECPTWEGFLSDVFARDAELIGYVRRLVGYSLTGLTTEHLLPFLYGVGANGKSTFLETLLKLFGPDYAMKAAPDLLMARRGESHPTDRADLCGMRLVAVNETEQDRRLNETLTKEITGGDTIRARRMREDFWEFRPTHTVWMAGNHKPRVVGTDNGIWRRVKLIPFAVTFPADKQDKRLGAKLEAELPGILNWAAVGCREWRKGGLNEPDVVKHATGEYASEQDEVGQFLDEWCEIGQDLTEGSAELLAKFGQACPNARLSPRAFADRLKAKGFVNRHPDGKEVRTKKGMKAWKGLRLREVISPEAAAFREALKRRAK